MLLTAKRLLQRLRTRCSTLSTRPRLFVFFVPFMFCYWIFSCHTLMSSKLDTNLTPLPLRTLISSHPLQNTVSFPKRRSNGVKWKPVQDKLSLITTSNEYKHSSRSHSGTRRSLRRSRGKPGSQDTTPLVEFVLKQRSIPANRPTLCYKTWNTSEPMPPRLHGCHIECVDDWQILDNPSQVQHAIARDATNGTLIVAKISPRQARHVAGKKNHQWNTIRTVAKLITENKPNIMRGQRNSGYTNHYSCFGWRKEQLHSGSLGEYSFNASTPTTDKQMINSEISNLVQRMEDAAGCLTNKTAEKQTFLSVKGALGLPSLPSKGCSTQFSVGYNYWSKVHSDDDYFFTHLSCVAQDPRHHEDILYYFLYPEYKLMVPLKSGDLIVFNPTEKHSCSNPKHPAAYIFSAYVSTKTVMTAGIGAGMHLP